MNTCLRFSRRGLLLLALTVLAAGVSGDSPSITPLGNNWFAVRNVPAGRLESAPGRGIQLNGKYRMEDLTSSGDRALKLTSLSNPSESYIVAPEYASGSPSAHTSGSAAAVSGAASSTPSSAAVPSPRPTLICAPEDPQALPELPEGTPPPANQPTSVLQPVRYSDIADRDDETARINLVDGARQIVRRYQNHADEDLRTLVNTFSALPEDQQREGLERSVEQLRRQSQTFEQANRSSMLPGERIRFRNDLANALDKAEAALSQGASRALPSLEAAARSSKLPSGTSGDALTDRMVLLNALPEQEREKALARLHLVETPTLSMKDGSKEKITIPHNGYWLGGSKTGTDCSGFASQSLPAEVRQMRFTTLDFRTLYQLARTGGYRPPPRYEAARLKRLERLAEDFEPVQPHLGEKLKPFDLLVYRIGAEPIGHVFIVEKYDSEKLEAGVLEASQSHGGLRSRTFNLSLDPIDSPNRVLRPGIFGLRLKREAISRKCSLQKRAQKGSSS